MVTTVLNAGSPQRIVGIVKVGVRTGVACVCVCVFYYPCVIKGLGLFVLLCFYLSGVTTVTVSCPLVGYVVSVGRE